MKNILKLFLSMAGSFIIILLVVDVQNIQVHAMVPEEMTPLLKSKENQKIAYLTFDDGPSLNTMKILDILDSYHVKATFFVKGNEEPYAKESYQEMVSAVMRLLFILIHMIIPSFIDRLRVSFKI